MTLAYEGWLVRLGSPTFLCVKDVRIKGTISSVGFSDGNRFVVGHWTHSPIGAFADLMWGTPEGKKILLTTNERVSNFVSAIYDFDETRIGELEIESDGRSIFVSGFGLEINLFGGSIRGFIPPRPLSFTRFIENPFASLLMGVQTFGTSSRGVTEWYQARKWRWVTSGETILDGRSLGSPSPFAKPLGVGFSEPPRKSAIVDLQVTIRFPYSITL